MPPFRIPKQLLAAFLVIQSAMWCGCRHSPAETASKLIDHGKVRLSSKDYSRAILDFKAALAATPDSPEAHYQLGLAYLGAGAVPQAEAEFRRAVQLRPSYVGAQVKIAELMLRNADAGEAEKQALDILRDAPDNADAMNVLALAEMKLGDTDSAEEQLKATLERFPQNLNASVVLATLKLQRRDFPGAEEALKAAVGKAPQSPKPTMALGQLYLVMGRWADAETQFRNALKVDDKSAVVLSGLATAELRQRRADQAEQTYRLLSQLPDKRYRHRHAAYLLQRGDYGTALKEFEALAAEDPKDKVPRIRLIEAYIQANRPAEAERVLGAALKADPKDVDALFRQTLLQLDSARDKEAEATLNRLVQVQPRSPAVHFLAARAARLHGEELRHRSELGEALRLGPEFLPARLELARTLAESNSAKAALDLLEQAPEAQRRTIGAVTTRALIFIALNQFQDARNEVNDGLALARTPDLLLQDAVLKLRDQNPAAARSVAVEVLQRNPEDLRALRIVAVSYLAQKKTDEAGKALRQYAASHPKAPRVQQFLGEWLLDMGHSREARTAFVAAKAANPRFFSADFALVRLDVSEGKLETARTTLLQVLQDDPKNFVAHSLLGSVETRLAHYPGAIEHYQQALEIRPNNPAIMNNLAYVLAESGQLEASLQLAQKAHELMPNSADAADTLGWVMYRRGLYDSAVTLLQEAVAKDGRSSSESAAVRKYHLAMAYTKAGDLDRAQKTLDEALKMNNTVAEASAASRVLESPVLPARPVR